MPPALLYKAQTAAGFSTLLPWNWINTMPVHVFIIISEHPEGPALTGHWPPVPVCSLLCVGNQPVWAMYGTLHAEQHIIRKQVCYSTLCLTKD